MALKLWALPTPQTILVVVLVPNIEVYWIESCLRNIIQTHNNFM